MKKGTRLGPRGPRAMRDPSFIPMMEIRKALVMDLLQHSLVPLTAREIKAALGFPNWMFINGDSASPIHMLILEGKVIRIGYRYAPDPDIAEMLKEK